MADKPLRVGVIGRTGKGNYGHGLDVVWQHVPNVHVAAVADDDDAGRAAAVKRTGAMSAYADYREMLDREQLDIVSICQRWIDQHHAMAVAAAEHGCHMYMEKPFCRTLEEADEVVRACEMRHLKLAIAHGNRYSPQLTAAKRLIRRGEIGDVLEIRARGKEDARRGGGEDLWVLGTHMLDLMRAIAGDVASCFATVHQDGQPVRGEHVQPGNEGIGPLAGDAIDAMYRFENGVIGHFASHRGKGNRFGLKVFGSKGIIELQSGYGSTAWVLKDPSWSPGRSGSQWDVLDVSAFDVPAGGSNLAAVLDLIDAIRRDRQPRSSMYDARAATEMIVAVFDSHRIGGPVTFPLENRRNPLTMLDR